MLEPLNNKRSEARESRACGTVNYSIDCDSNNLFSVGISIDMSDSGIGIFTRHELSRGAVVKLKGEKLWEGVRFARIMWCDRVGGGIYRVGMSFIGPESPV